MKAWRSSKFGQIVPPRAELVALDSKPVFLSFSDTQCLFLDVALLVEILKGSLFLHLMTTCIWATIVHS